VAWRAQVGKGHSAVSVANGLAYTLGWDGSRDTAWCLDAFTGAVVWRQSYPCATIKQWPGPRSTPAVADDTVYTLGQHGQLRAWDARTGSPRWSRDLPRTYQPDVDYGFPWSPLILDDLLVLGTGSCGLAVRTQDGSFAWGADEKAGACASPVPWPQGGKLAVLLVTMSPDRSRAGLAAVEAGTGRRLWKAEVWNEKWGAVCNDLVADGRQVFVSSAETFSLGASFEVRSEGRLEQRWASPKLSCYTGNAVLAGGYLYLVGKSGLLKCVDWEDGREAWSERGFGSHGTLIWADRTLFVLSSQTGELTAAAAQPGGYAQHRRAHPFSERGASFTAPALAQGRLYCRNYAGEVVCLEVGELEPASKPTPASERAASPDQKPAPTTP
jgi:outer membrane protein assembly factor BamB